MDDKTFELLEKMYSEFTARFSKVDSRFDEIDTRLDKVDSRLDKVENRLDKLDVGQKKLEITLENDIKTSLQALHEREAANSEKLEDHSKQLTIINDKLDYLALSVNSQDKRLEVVESSRKRRAK